jgi:acyl carrier protein
MSDKDKRPNAGHILRNDASEDLEGTTDSILDSSTAAITEGMDLNALASNYIRQHADNLGISPFLLIDDSKPLVDQGVDSLMACALVNRLKTTLGLALPPDLSVNELSVAVLAQLAAAQLGEKKLALAGLTALEKRDLSTAQVTSDEAKQKFKGDVPVPSEDWPNRVRPTGIRESTQFPKSPFLQVEQPELATSLKEGLGFAIDLPLDTEPATPISNISRIKSSLKYMVFEASSLMGLMQNIQFEDMLREKHLLTSSLQKVATVIHDFENLIEYAQAQDDAAEQLGQDNDMGAVARGGKDTMSYTKSHHTPERSRIDTIQELIEHLASGTIEEFEREYVDAQEDLPIEGDSTEYCDNTYLIITKSNGRPVQVYEILSHPNEAAHFATVRFIIEHLDSRYPSTEYSYSEVGGDLIPGNAQLGFQKADIIAVVPPVPRRNS